MITVPICSAIGSWCNPHSGYAPKQRESTGLKDSDAATPRMGASYPGKHGQPFLRPAVSRTESGRQLFSENALYFSAKIVYTIM